MQPKKNRPKDKSAPAGVTLTVRIQPRASKNEAVRQENGGLKIRLTARPWTARPTKPWSSSWRTGFSVAKSQVEIISGHTSRDKIVRISG